MRPSYLPLEKINKYLKAEWWHFHQKLNEKMRQDKNIDWLFYYISMTHIYLFVIPIYCVRILIQYKLLFFKQKPLKIKKKNKKETLL